MLDFSGSFAPIVTPFTDDSWAVSEVRLARIVRWLTGCKVDGFVLASEAGEFRTVSSSERKQLLEIVLRESQNQVPVLTNVSSMSTSMSIDLAQHADRHGARGLLLMPPFCGRFTDEEVIDHIRAVAQFGQLPVVVVDPEGRLSEPMWENLLNTQNLHRGGAYGNLPVSTCAFECRGVVCVPSLGAFGSEISDFDLLSERAGAARVCKAALMEQDRQVGPCRAPLKALAAEYLSELRPYLAGR